ncbi:MAG: hypothetical protein P8Z79_17235 [Sedimentisphaerales bacterium]
MATKAQIKANRLNAQKSTGPKTVVGKAMVAQNALKHGLFAQQNVINCEKMSDFYEFRTEVLGGLAPVGGVEAMMAERIVSLSWRLKRVERMHSEAIDVLVARAETDLWQKNRRKETEGAHDQRAGGLELILGWATVHDFSESKVLERLLMYEKRIEGSLYKAISELQKLQRGRKNGENEDAEADPAISLLQPRTPCGAINGNRDEAATQVGERAECAKQSQLVGAENGVTCVSKEGCENKVGVRLGENEAERSQILDNPAVRVCPDTVPT